MKRVVVHIDRLVLKGFRPEDRHAIAAGLEQELGRVFSDREAVSLLGVMRNVPRLLVAGVPIEAGSTPQSSSFRLAPGSIAQMLARARPSSLGKAGADFVSLKVFPRSLERSTFMPKNGLQLEA